MKAVESQDAEWAVPKYEVITGWEDAIMVVSKKQMNCVASICENMTQNRVVDKPARNREGLSVLLSTELGTSRVAAVSRGCRKGIASLGIESSELLGLLRSSRSGFVSYLLLEFAMTMTGAGGLEMRLTNGERAASVRIFMAMLRPERLALVP